MKLKRNVIRGNTVRALFREKWWLIFFLLPRADLLPFVADNQLINKK